MKKQTVKIRVAMIAVWSLMGIVCPGMVAENNISSEIQMEERGKVWQVREFPYYVNDLGLQALRQNISSKASHEVCLPLNDMASVYVGSVGGGHKEISLKSGLTEPINTDSLGATLHDYLNGLKDNDSDGDVILRSLFWYDEKYVCKKWKMTSAKIKTALDVEYVSDIKTVGLNDIYRLNMWVDSVSCRPAKFFFDLDQFKCHYLFANVLNFKGDWSKPFPKDVNVSRFMMMDGTGKDKYFLATSDTLGYIRTGECEVVEIPYKGGRYKFIGVLPAARYASDLQKFAESLTPETIIQWQQNQKYTPVKVRIPPFEIFRPTINPEWMETLFPSPEYLHYPEEFFKNYKRGGKPYLGYLSVANFMFGWQGTEGMPVDFGCDPTGDASHVEGSEEDGKDTVEVSFNRPFIYMVIDGETGVALIMGVLLDPDSQPVIVADTAPEVG